AKIALMVNLSHYESDNLAEDNKNVNEILTAELERYKNQERILKEQNNVDKASVSYEQSLEIKKLKHTLSEHLKEKESLEQKQLKPKLYDGSVIQKNDAIVIHDSKETLMLTDESRSKMLLKQNDPIMSEKKVITKPVDYAALNQLSKDFETHFVPQTELSAEQAFWSRYLVESKEPTVSSSTTIVEVPKELPKVSMAVEQHSVEKNKFQDKMKNVLKDNERLLEQALIVDIVNIVVHDHVNSAYKTVNNNNKKIRLTKHIPLSGNTPTKTTSSINIVSNTPVLSSTGVNLLSSASGSQPQGNTKNDRIQRTPKKGGVAVTVHGSKGGFYFRLLFTAKGVVVRGGQQQHGRVCCRFINKGVFVSGLLIRACLFGWQPPPVGVRLGQPKQQGLFVSL
nr:hypothetical protein [Tanacetum cinerariifolium]